MWAITGFCVCMYVWMVRIAEAGRTTVAMSHRGLRGDSARAPALVCTAVQVCKLESTAYISTRFEINKWKYYRGRKKK
jgi:hypothetical protein